MRVFDFFKQVLAVAIGFIFSLLFLSFLAALVVFQITSNKTPYLTKNSVLELNLQQVVELSPNSILEYNNTITDLHTIQKTISRAAQDTSIKGIYLNVSNLQAGWAILEEIRNALLEFKQTKKPIIAYGNSYSQKAYYVASIADKIMLHPYGTLELKGLALTVNFFTNLLKNIGIDSTILRIGAYKSALEPFYLNKMSNESRQQTQCYLNTTYNYFLNNIGKTRKITIDKLKGLVENLAATLPTEALQANLITHVGYEQDAKSLFMSKGLGTNPPSSSQDHCFVDYYRYASIKEKNTNLSKVAVMLAEGTITHGQSSLGYIGSKDFVNTMQALIKDSSIKAVVLRINSPGGNFFDSDVMWKAIDELKQHKPIVASMSNFAASGGYYIAAPCHYIFAQPTSLTGSIGIFYMLNDATKLMQKIGIEKDVVKTAPSADFLSPRTTCSETELKVLYKYLQQGYDAFLEKVSTGRKLDLNYVKNIASGQVFTGIAAQQNKLVDELGGLQNAIAKAADLANLTGKYAICYVPYPKSKLSILFDHIISNIKMHALFNFADKAILDKKHKIYSKNSFYENMKAIFPYDMDIN